MANYDNVVITCKDKEKLNQIENSIKCIVEHLSRDSESLFVRVINGYPHSELHRLITALSENEPIITETTFEHEHYTERNIIKHKDGEAEQIGLEPNYSIGCRDYDVPGYKQWIDEAVAVLGKLDSTVVDEEGNYSIVCPEGETTYTITKGNYKIKLNKIGLHIDVTLYRPKITDEWEEADVVNSIDCDDMLF